MNVLTKILNRFTGSLIFEAEVDGETESIRLGLVAKLALEAKADLRYSDLRGSDLRGSDLSYSDLSYSDLSYSDLRGSNLRGSYLIGSDLSYSDLSGSDLSGSDLRGSNLSGSYLRGFNLRGEKLIGDRPVIQIGPIGSRSDYLIAYFTDKGIRIMTGNTCFFGTVEEFESAVVGKHGHNQHAQEYRAALEFIKVHGELWAAQEEATAEPEGVHPKVVEELADSMELYGQQIPTLLRPVPQTDCGDCDGCGWYEGGPTIKTACKTCNGTGKVSLA